MKGSINVSWECIIIAMGAGDRPQEYLMARLEETNQC